ncbi:hypothetical protein Tco_0365633 [Tanacetum coccineum]
MILKEGLEKDAIKDAKDADSDVTFEIKPDQKNLLADYEKDQQLCFDDLDQLNKQDLEEYDLKHQMAMLSIRVRRFAKRNAGRKIKINGREIARAPTSQTEYSTYKAREERNSQPDKKALVSIDGCDSAEAVDSADCVVVSAERIQIMPLCHMTAQISFYILYLNEHGCSEPYHDNDSQDSTSVKSTEVLSEETESCGKYFRDGVQDKIDSKRKTPTDVSADRSNPISADTPISAEFTNSADTGKSIPAGYVIPARRARNVFYFHLLIRLGPDPGFATTMRDKLERILVAMDGGEGYFGGREFDILTGKGTIRNQTMDFEMCLYVNELDQFQTPSHRAPQHTRVIRSTRSYSPSLKNETALSVLRAVVRKFQITLDPQPWFYYDCSKRTQTCILFLALMDFSYSRQHHSAYAVARLLLMNLTKWHRRIGVMYNFKNMKNILVSGNPCTRPIPSKAILECITHVCCQQQKGNIIRLNTKRISAVSLIHHPLQCFCIWKPFTVSVRSIKSQDQLSCHTEEYTSVIGIFMEHKEFDGKSDEGYIVGYSTHGRAYRVYNLASHRIEETMNLNFLENKPNIQGTGQAWYFDLDYLTDSLNYSRSSSTNLSAGTQATASTYAGSQDHDDSDSDDEQDVIIIPSYPTTSFVNAAWYSTKIQEEESEGMCNLHVSVPILTS